MARYLAELATATENAPALRIASIERRLAGLIWNCNQRGQSLDRSDPVLMAALADLRAAARPSPKRKDPISPEELFAMVATLPFDLRGLRDRALLLLGYGAGLGRSALVGLDLLLEGRSEISSDGTGTVLINEEGAVVQTQSRTGLRTTHLPRAPNEQECALHALEQWCHFGKIQSGPLFVRISRDCKRALDTRLNDKHVARLIKSTINAAGLRPELSEKERMALFSGHSLRSGHVEARKAAKPLEGGQSSTAETG
jgi:integrase